nr:hypothetical protein [Allomuricauda sp.]
MSSTLNWIFQESKKWQPAQHIPLRSTTHRKRADGHSTSGKALHSKTSWTPSQFLAFHSVTPVRDTGQGHCIPEPKRGWSPLHNGKPSLRFSQRDFRQVLLEHLLENP